MSRKNLSERTVQELLERAAEFDALAATAKARKAKHALEAFPARSRILAACRAANGRPDEGPSAAALVEIQVHHHPAH